MSRAGLRSGRPLRPTRPSCPRGSRSYSPILRITVSAYAEPLAQKLHPAVQVDAHGGGPEPRPLRDLRAGHALDEAEHERLAVSLGQRADDLQRLARLGPAPGALRYLVVQLLGLARAPVEVRGAVARDDGDPRPEALGVAQVPQFAERR